MCIFYTLHHLFNQLEVNVDKDGNIEHGKRNCKLAMIGGLIYIILFFLIKDRKIVSGNVRYDGLLSALFYMFILDVSAMAYTYKNYFGRSITHELGENDYKFNYDPKTHKYTRKIPKIDQFKVNLNVIRNNRDYKETQPKEIRRLFTGKQCCICLDEFDLDKDILVSLPCGHVLHKECKNEIRNKKCPECRAEF